jgi:hypothetical protein
MTSSERGIASYISEMKSRGIEDLRHWKKLTRLSRVHMYPYCRHCRFWIWNVELIQILWSSQHQCCLQAMNIEYWILTLGGNFWPLQALGPFLVPLCAMFALLPFITVLSSIMEPSLPTSNGDMPTFCLKHIVLSTAERCCPLSLLSHCVHWASLSRALLFMNW